MDPAIDPICGTQLDPRSAKTVRVGDVVLSFCSELCRAEYQRERGLERLHEARGHRRIAYFSMEIAAHPQMPTYAGGLGVLAGDMLRASADLQVPLVGVTLLYRRGYLVQRLDASGRQLEEPATWHPDQDLRALEPVVEVPLGRRVVRLRAWRYDFVGVQGYVVPALFLDADLPGNAEADRRLTDTLYGGDAGYRLSQEVLLGVGGVRMLDALGYQRVRTLHLNEGHAALAAVELLRQQAAAGQGWEPELVRGRCTFTTHTPVPAAHDQFDYRLAAELLEPLVPLEVLQRYGGAERLNLTLLALNLSGRVNGVAARNQEVSETLYPGRDIRHVTNGVHSQTWTGEALAALYDRHLPHWRRDPSVLRMAMHLPKPELWVAHQEAKGALLRRVRDETGRALPPERLTVGFARRSTDYKRPDLVFHDLERLRGLGRGRLQLVLAGKAHGEDARGKELIRRAVEVGRTLGDEVPVVYLANYEMTLARTLIAGCDVWLNTPLRPLEASGTSGMKAAHNAVPSLSVLDGWWVEGCIEGVTGWAVGTDGGARAVVLPLYEQQRERWLDVMRAAVAVNASYFNAHRMVQQYLTSAWNPAPAG